MKIVRRDVYVSEFTLMTFPQKAFHVAANYYKPDFYSLKPNLNPLYWCLMDLVKLLRIALLIFVIYPFIAPLLIIYEAATITKKYSDKKFRCARLSNAYYLELSK